MYDKFVWKGHDLLRSDCNLLSCWPQSFALVCLRPKNGTELIRSGSFLHFLVMIFSVYPWCYHISRTSECTASLSLQKRKEFPFLIASNRNKFFISLFYFPTTCPSNGLSYVYFSFQHLNALSELCLKNSPSSLWISKKSFKTFAPFSNDPVGVRIST